MALGTKEGHLTLPWGIWKSLGGDTQVRDGVVVGLAKRVVERESVPGSGNSVCKLLEVKDKSKKHGSFRKLSYSFHLYYKVELRDACNGRSL